LPGVIASKEDLISTNEEEWHLEQASAELSGFNGRINQ
jgi:hypothetical protein